MSKLTGRIVKVTASVLISVMLGMLVGILVNANFAEKFQFIDVPGSDGSGSIGLICGSVVLMLVSAYYWVKGKNTK